MAAIRRITRACGAPSEPWTFDQFAAVTFDRGLWFEPGQGWAYSNPGYMLLKRIVERVSGRSLRDLVADRICRPLALRRTYVAQSIADLADLAPAMSSALSPEGVSRDVRAHYHPGWVSHGVIASTASDVARFIDALVGGALLSAASLAGMTDVVALPSGPADPPSPTTGPARVGTPSYGLGIMGDPNSPWGLALGHNGGGPGYAASVFRVSEPPGATACALGAFEEFPAADLVYDVFDSLAVHRSP
jgi:D-alanyl-D-alanine carboxypeptidase